MTGTIILIVVLILAALLLFAVEICTPTFGVLGLAGVGALAWAVYLAFELNPIFGIATLVALLIGVPVYLWATVKWLPKTAVGRILQLRIRKAAPGEGTPFFLVDPTADHWVYGGIEKPKGARRCQKN